MYEDLKKLNPSSVWKCFSEIVAIPRPSGHRDAIREYLLSYGRSLGLETLRDDIGNVLIRKPAYKGREDRPGIILQAHMDMVPQKDDNKVFDFTKDAVEAFVDGEWVKAKQTTLGADNGIGVATAMAILADKNIVHPPLEAFFTVDEETGMYGAYELKPNWLKGKYLLNLDSETEGMLFIGCAGGVNANASLKIDHEEIVNADKYCALQVAVSDCLGGHSGIDIILQRANAIKTLFRWLKKEEGKIQIAEAEGGSLRNAIARTAKAVIVIQKNELEHIIASIKDTDKVLKDEYKNVDNQINLSYQEVDMPSKVLSKSSQAALIDGIILCPHGVYRMFSDLPGIVETSNNVAMLQQKDDHFFVTCLIRSNRESRKTELRTNVETAMKCAGWNIDFDGDYPGWQPNLESNLLRTMKTIYHKEFNKEPEILVIHAGLECGIIGSNYPDMEMISFGPTIEHPHSPAERVNIQSVADFYKFVISSLSAF